MKLSRRSLLAASGAFLLPKSLGAATTPHSLVAEAGRQALLEVEGPLADIWCYGGWAPGPLLRLRQGQELAVRLENRIEQPTTVHWHGIRIDNAMDGVAGMTQAAVPPGGGFDYRFTPPDAGTFWYHPHTGQSWEQLARGLYGVLIVEEPEPQDFDQDLLFVADDWWLTNGEIDEASMGRAHDFFHRGRLGNVLTINGKPYETYRVTAGERIRLRMLSTANARVMRFRLPSSAWLIALDGQPVKPRPLQGTITLAPGQRADVALDLTKPPGAEETIYEATGLPIACATLAYSEQASRPLRSAPPPPLPANPLPRLGDERRTIDLIMEGGAMRFLEEAVYKGEVMNGRDLAMEAGQFWAFNGVAGMSKRPLLSARRGETWVIRMVNRTAFPHAMHLHGHHMRELARSDGPPETEAWRDTVLMQPDAEVTVASSPTTPASGCFTATCWSISSRHADLDRGRLSSRQTM